MSIKIPLASVLQKSKDNKALGMEPREAERLAVDEAAAEFQGFVRELTQALLEALDGGDTEAEALERVVERFAPQEGSANV